MITVEITMMHWQGLTDLGAGTSYTPLALVNSDPAGFTVRADSPYKSVKEVIDARKANPGKLKASGTGQGGIWHLALAGLLDDLKIPQTAIPWVPSQRRGAGHAGPGRRRRRYRHLLAARGAAADRRRQGEAARRDGRQARRAVPQRADDEGRRPAVSWTVAAWRGIAGAQGPARGRRAKLIAAIKKIGDSKEFKDFAASKGYGTAWAPGPEFATFMAKGDADHGQDDEGGRPREVTPDSSSGASAGRRRPPRRPAAPVCHSAPA